jgi:hypothetical protein
MKQAIPELTGMARIRHSRAAVAPVMEITGNLYDPATAYKNKARLTLGLPASPQG